MKYVFFAVLIFIAILGGIALWNLPTLVDMFVLPTAVAGAFFLGSFMEKMDA